MDLKPPPAEASAAMAFGLNPLDRMSERREDGPFIAALRADPAARALLFALPDIVLRSGPPSDLDKPGGGSAADPDRNARRTEAATDRRDVLDPGLRAEFTAAEATAAGADWDNAVYLGTGERPLFAAAVAAAPAGAEAHNLRAAAVEGRLPQAMLGIAAQARAVLGWHASHGFCANCGAPTTSGMAGMRRECGTCGTHHFPRTDPVVIMLAIDGERCLLGRQRRFVARTYSCLAGFMEPGETVEAAVRREIWEEAGIRTGHVAYHASQPWPFPSNLMIGCFAEATSFDVAPRDSELEDVRWFPRSDIPALLDGTHPEHAAPPPVAIAHHLLAAYAREGAAVVGSTAVAVGAAAIVGAMS